jgi:hypothetical protein
MMESTYDVRRLPGAGQVFDPELVEQYAVLHRSIRYGTTSENLLDVLGPEIRELNPRTVLDYGCGQSRLAELLQSRFGILAYRYDPAIREICCLPVAAADLVVNTDVLEHVPERDLDAVLSEIRRISSRALFAIATAPAQTVLPNGQNAHCTVHSASWWQDRLRRHFEHVEHVRPPTEKRCVFRTWEAQRTLWRRYLRFQRSLEERVRHKVSVGRLLAKVERWQRKQTRRSRAV